MKIIRQWTAVCLCLLFMAQTVLFSSSATKGEGISWFTQRREGHIPPTLDPSLSAILGHRAVYLDNRAADSSDKIIYLTFDAGYENGNVEKVVDTLIAKNVPAAFFVLSYFIRKNPDLLKKMHNNGLLICNHSSNHPDMSTLGKEGFLRELQENEKQYREVTGWELAKFYRPPQGRFREENLVWAEEAGYTTVFWSLCYADWDNQAQPAPEKAKALLMKYIHPGAIVLLHPTSRTNAEVIGEMIESWRAEGYRFGSLTDLQK